MTRKERIIQAMYDAADELNQQLPKEQQLEKSIDTIIMGSSGTLDSLGLLNLIVAIEHKIEEEFKVAISLADEKAFTQKNSPFESIESLAGYIFLILEERAIG